MKRDFLQLIEDRIRLELEAGHPDGRPRSVSDAQLAEVLANGAVQLREKYLSGRNPVDVWQAILNLHVEAQLTGKPLNLPPWVLAYLARVAHGISSAVNRPDQVLEGPEKGKLKPGTRRRKDKIAPPAKTNPDGGKHHYSDWFGGVSTEERLALALEAFGFSQESGRPNALVRAYRESREMHLARAALEQRCLGNSISKIAENIDDAALNRVGDKGRKLKRVIRLMKKGPKAR